MTTRYLTLSLTLTLTLALYPTVGVLHAASLPHAGSAEKTPVVWTNEEVEKLDPGFVSVVGQIPKDDTAGDAVAALYLSTKDPDWYAVQAAQLREEIERRNAQLDGYRRAIRDATTLETSTGGVNLDQGDIAITPETAIDILEQRVKETQAKFDELEDLARRNDIAPGTLRGQ